MCKQCCESPIIYSYGKKEIAKYIRKILQICKLCCKTCKKGNNCESLNDNMALKSCQPLKSIKNETPDIKKPHCSCKT